jgi:hypothetical protein
MDNVYVDIWSSRHATTRIAISIAILCALYGATPSQASPAVQASDHQWQQVSGPDPESTPGLVHRPLAPSELPSAAELHALEATELSALTTSPAAEVIKIARREIGHHEGAGNCTKYGAWFGVHCAQWCDIFISWVFHQAGHLDAIGHKQSAVDSHIAWFRKHKRFHTKPCVGCILFLDTNNNRAPNHVGIVRSFTSTRVHTIEGNASDKVSAVKYARSDRRILGYGYPDWNACPSGSVHTACRCGGHSSGCRPQGMSSASFCDC